MLDARAICAAASLREILASYGVEFSGARGPCPLCRTSANSDAFVLFKDGLGFFCHACGAKGDAIDLEARLSGTSKGAAMHRLAGLLGISPSEYDQETHAREKAARERKAAGAKITAEIELGRAASYAKQLRELRARVRYAGMDELALLYERISQLEQWFHLQDARAEEEGVREWANTEQSV